MIAVVDYGAGNLFSVANALQFLGIDYKVTKEREVICAADGIILPGVGAFPDAMARLGETGLVKTLQEEAEKKPFLGICLGMQMLFEYGYEFEQVAGLGLIPGVVEKFAPSALKVPHMGWNSVEVVHESPLTEGVADGDYLYFVHSYLAKTDAAYISLRTHYGEAVPALVRRGSVYGAQFHPEKSGTVGLQILKNFGGLV